MLHLVSLSTPIDIHPERLLVLYDCLQLCYSNDSKLDSINLLYVHTSAICGGTGAHLCPH